MHLGAFAIFRVKHTHSQDRGGPMKQGFPVVKSDIETLRARLRAIPDSQLLQVGQAAKMLCGPEINSDGPPLELYVVQLREAREEWRRRHPKLPQRDAFC
jgi:hypothetical protein